MYKAYFNRYMQGSLNFSWVYNIISTFLNILIVFTLILGPQHSFIAHTIINTFLFLDGLP